MVVFDSIANEAAHEVLGDSVVYAESVAQCLALSEVVVIANKLPELDALRADDFPRRAERIVVFDCWRIFRTRLKNCEWVRYVPLGCGGQANPSSDKPAPESTAGPEVTPGYADGHDALREQD